jgi:RNA polymerase sigma factor (TIGR02999 family)
VYEELRVLASAKLSHERPGQTLQATALVHEAYLRLVRDGSETWENRGHFFVAAAEAMRRILVEKARQKQSLRKGHGHRRVDLEEDLVGIEDPAIDIIALDEALSNLEAEAPLAAKVVKLRYFSGLTLEEVGQTMNCSRRTVSSYWAYAQAWLHREMSQDGDSV